MTEGELDIKIDKDIPIPITASGVVTKYAHAVRALAVGESFYLPKEDVGHAFSGAVKRIAKTIGIKTVVRTVNENGTKGWRVWRVE